MQTVLEAPGAPNPRVDAARSDEMSESPVDLKHLREVADGDLEFERELIDLFLTDVGDRVAAIADALQRGDHERVRRESHSLKGAAANMGARPLKRAASELELASRAGDLSDGPRLVAALAHEAERARKVLETRRNSSL